MSLRAGSLGSQIHNGAALECQGHPHAEGSYRVIPFDNGLFGVEVSIPDSPPTRVSNFKTKADAEAWITEASATDLPA
jgi:hypothetical protein